MSATSGEDTTTRKRGRKVGKGKEGACVLGVDDAYEVNSMEISGRIILEYLDSLSSSYLIYDIIWVRLHGFWLSMPHGLSSRIHVRDVKSFTWFSQI